MGRFPNGGLHPGRIQITDPRLEIAELKTAVLKGRQLLERQHAIIEMQQAAIARYRLALLDLLKDADPTDPTKPVHSISRERIAAIDLQDIRMEVLPREDHLALDIHVWTGEAGDQAMQEIIKRVAASTGPEEPLEVVRKLVTPH